MAEETKKRKTTTSAAVKRKYNKKAYDAATAYVKKGQLAFLKQIAEEHPTIERNGEIVKNSVSTLIITALTKYLAEEYNIDFNDFPAPSDSEEQEN